MEVSASPPAAAAAHAPLPLPNTMPPFAYILLGSLMVAFLGAVVALHHRRATMRRRQQQQQAAEQQEREAAEKLQTELRPMLLPPLVVNPDSSVHLGSMRGGWQGDAAQPADGERGRVLPWRIPQSLPRLASKAHMLTTLGAALHAGGTDSSANGGAHGLTVFVCGSETAFGCVSLQPQGADLEAGRR